MQNYMHYPVIPHWVVTYLSCTIIVYAKQYDEALNELWEKSHIFALQDPTSNAVSHGNTVPSRPRGFSPYARTGISSSVRAHQEMVRTAFLLWSCYFKFKVSFINHLQYIYCALYFLSTVRVVSENCNRCILEFVVGENLPLHYLTKTE